MQHIWLLGVIDIAEFDSSESLTPQSLTPRSHWHRRVLLLGVIDTAELDSSDSLTPQSLTPRSHWHRRVWLLGVIDTAEFDSSESLTPQSLTQLRQMVYLATQRFCSILCCRSKIKNMKELHTSTVYQGHLFADKVCTSLLCPYTVYWMYKVNFFLSIL